MKEELSLGEQSIVKRFQRAREIANQVEICSNPGKTILICKAYDELLRLEQEAQELESAHHRSPG